MERAPRIFTIICLGILLSGCNIRYISHESAAEFQEQQAEPETTSQSAEPTMPAAEAEPVEKPPWYRRVFAVEWAPDTTQPVEYDLVPNAAESKVPPQASGSTRVETAPEIASRQEKIGPEDPLLNVHREWVIESGMTLESGLRKWAHDAGLQLRWDVPRIFEIHADIHINGSFEFAFSRVMEAYALAEHPVLFDYGMYANQVLRVTLKGEFSQ